MIFWWDDGVVGKMNLIRCCTMCIVCKPLLTYTRVRFLAFHIIRSSIQNIYQIDAFTESKCILAWLKSYIAAFTRSHSYTPKMETNITKFVFCSASVCNIFCIWLKYTGQWLMCTKIQKKIFCLNGVYRILMNFCHYFCRRWILNN